MNKASIIGHFGENSNQLSGQIVKTKIITKALKDLYGEKSIKTFDTKGGLKTLFKARRMVNLAFSNSENVVILPAQNALRVFAPLVALKRRKNANVKIHYIVIGGWLPVFLKKHSYLEKPLKKFDSIFVETSTMKKALDSMGFENVFVCPNCKELEIIKADALSYEKAEPLRLCTFSRVMKEKGIEDAVNAVKKVNNNLGRTVYSLDIYGKVENGQEEWFRDLQASFPPFVEYKGEVAFEKTAQAIKNYYALLFPTKFFTEGIPGTIIDAYAAGVPVISSKWESFSDLVDEGKTGLGYDFGNTDMFADILFDLAKDPEKLFPFKESCIKKALDYSPRIALMPLIERLD